MSRNEKVNILHPEIIHEKIALNISKRLQKKRKFKLLKLRHHKIPQIPRQSKILMQSLKFLKQLNISEAGLQNLINFPTLPTLQNLDLTMNKLADDSIKYILNCENLRVIYLTENKIQYLASLYKLEELKFLTEIDITKNLLTYTVRQVFDAFPQISIVDRFDKEFRDLESLNLSDSDSEDDSSKVKLKRKKSESELSEVVFTEDELKKCEQVIFKDRNQYQSNPIEYEGDQSVQEVSESQKSQNDSDS